MIKEYSENSYFNEIFASYLMIPLRNPENPRLRSNFWIMETIQFLKISNEKVMFPDYDLLTNAYSCFFVNISVINTTELFNDGHRKRLSIIRHLLEIIEVWKNYKKS